jgi:hypothetical protein
MIKQFRLSPSLVFRKGVCFAGFTDWQYQIAMPCFCSKPRGLVFSGIGFNLQYSSLGRTFRKIPGF